jgi:hypothetical protein
MRCGALEDLPLMPVDVLCIDGPVARPGRRNTLAVRGVDSLPGRLRATYQRQT